MKLIICGSRDIDDQNEGFAWIDSLASAALPSGVLEDVTQVLSGGCRGVDAIGEAWAREHGIPLRIVEAQWEAHGKKAGPLRNAYMVGQADAVVAIAYPDSRGTKDCVRRAVAKGIPVAMLILPRAK